MTRCIYPDCPKRATIGCTCHLGDGWFCEEHLENHLEAESIKLHREANQATKDRNCLT